MSCILYLVYSVTSCTLEILLTTLKFTEICRYDKKYCIKYTNVSPSGGTENIGSNFFTASNVTLGLVKKK